MDERVNITLTPKFCCYKTWKKRKVIVLEHSDSLKWKQSRATMTKNYFFPQNTQRHPVIWKLSSHNIIATDNFPGA